MKHSFIKTLALLAVAGGTVFGQSVWTTVDSFQSSPGNSANNSSISVDKMGRVLAAGIAMAGSNQDAVAHLSVDQGLSWSTADFSGALGAVSFSGCGADASGGLYAVGSAADSRDANAGRRWIVRKSTDGGMTWNVVDDFAPVMYSGGHHAWARSFASDSSGNIYVGGYAYEKTINGRSRFDTPHWIVRKSADNGLTWATVDDFVYNSGNTQLNGIVASSGALYAVGVGSTSVTHWLVRKSTDGGASWISVDDFTLGSNSTRANAVAVDLFGNVYVTGTGAIALSSKTTVQSWVVRKSSSGGQAWSTVDSYRPSATGSAFGNGITLTPQGIIYAIGSANDGSNHWLIRRSTDGGFTWTADDDYQTGVNAPRPNAIACDAYGNVYAAGAATDANGQHAIVRKLAP